jgi:hypothetical protein
MMSVMLGDVEGGYLGSMGNGEAWNISTSQIIEDYAKLLFLISCSRWPMQFFLQF